MSDKVSKSSRIEAGNREKQSFSRSLRLSGLGQLRGGVFYV